MKIDFTNSKIINIDIDGWINFNIRYYIYRYVHETYLIWNVIGTEHIFKVPLKIVTTHHGPKYEEHFILTLKKLKEDLKDWYNLGLPEDWMKNYYNQFFKLLDSPFE